MRPRLLPLLLAGCVSPLPANTDVTLAHYRTLEIVPQDQRIDIFIGESYPLSGYFPCPLLDANVTARLNGISVPLVKRGGKIGDEPGDDVSDNVCGPPMLEFGMPPPAGPSTLELFDPAVRIVCTLPDLKAARAMTLVPPTDPWEWRASQTVTVQWSPSGDLPLWNLGISVALFRNDPSGNDATIPDVTFDHDVMHLMIPPVPPGSYRFSVRPFPTVLCDEPFHAELALPSGFFNAEHAVTIVP
jgi:hypothetical protein